MEADNVVLDRAAVIEVSSMSPAVPMRFKLTLRPQSNAYPQSAQPTSKPEKSKSESLQRHLMNLDLMARLEDKDCLGKWARRRGMSGWSGLERRIRSGVYLV